MASESLAVTTSKAAIGLAAAPVTWASLATLATTGCGLPGELAGKSLWWNTCKNAWTQNQGDNGMAKKTVANAMERINKRCDISESKLKGFQGRKTMATMGRNLFSIDNTMIQAVGNWEDPKEIEDYVDP